MENLLHKSARTQKQGNGHTPNERYLQRLTRTSQQTYKQSIENTVRDRDEPYDLAVYSQKLKNEVNKVMGDIQRGNSLVDGRKRVVKGKDYVKDMLSNVRDYIRNSVKGCLSLGVNKDRLSIQGVFYTIQRITKTKERTWRLFMHGLLQTRLSNELDQVRNMCGYGLCVYYLDYLHKLDRLTTTNMNAAHAFVLTKNYEAMLAFIMPTTLWWAPMGPSGGPQFLPVELALWEAWNNPTHRTIMSFIVSFSSSNLDDSSFKDTEWEVAVESVMHTYYTMSVSHKLYIPEQLHTRANAVFYNQHTKVFYFPL